MSAEMTVKKRGRPKKLVDQESVVLVNGRSELLPGTIQPEIKKSRTSRVSKVEVAGEGATKKNTTRKSKLNVAEVQVDVVDVVQTRRPAKSIENAAPSLPNAKVSLQPDPTKGTLRKSSPVNENSTLSPISLSGTDLVNEREPRRPKLEVASSINSSQITKPVLNSSFEDTTSPITNIIPESIDQDSSQSKILSDNISRALTDDFDAQITELEIALNQNNQILQLAANEFESLRRDRRSRILTSIVSDQLDQLTRQSREAAAQIELIKSQRESAQLETIESHNIPEPFQTHIAITEHLDFASEQIKAELLRIQAHITTLLQLPSNNINIGASTTSVPLEAGMLFSHLPLERVTFSNVPQTQPQLEFSTSTTEPPATTPMNSRAASTVTSPQSPSNSRSSGKPSALRPPQPLSPTTKPVPPPTRRPTEQTLAELKKDPKFKRLSRSWTGLIVGIPVVIATSVILWKNYQQKQMERSLGLEPHIGVDSKKVGVNVNGGV